MSEKIYPQLDEYRDQPGVTRYMEEILSERAMREFERLHPEWLERYYSDKNLELFAGWITSKGVPITVRNLEVGFRDLVGEGLLQPNPEPKPEPVPLEACGITQMKDTCVVREATPEDSAENLRRLKSLSPEELKREAYRSRFENQTVKQEPKIVI